MAPCPERDRPAGTTTTEQEKTRSRGQILVIYAGAIVFFIGLMAIVIDITWFWTNSLKVQRAADAAALAGAVQLPDFPTTARRLARDAATQNGYTNGTGGVTVTANPNPTRDIQLDTRISAPVPTFFMRLFGINSITATRTAKAEYVLPVPMGSPLNYFGAFGTLRGGMIQTDSGWQYPTATRKTSVPATDVPDTWTTPTNAFVDESPDPVANSTTANTTDAQGFTKFRSENSPSVANFGMNLTPGAVRFQARGGIEVVVQASSSVDGCRLQAEVSSNSNLGPSATWHGAPATANNNPAILTTTPREFEFGGDASTGATDSGDWWRTTGWTVANFSDASFAVRLRAVGTGACTTATTTVDYLKVRVNYEESEPPIKGPNNESLLKQGIWATVNSQGADAINGDIYSPQYNGNPTANTEYKPGNYYDYAVEMQPGTTGGSLYVFDPVFCATDTDGSKGMGDRWYGGSGAMSTFYDLYDTNNTPYDFSDDAWIAGNTGPAGAGNPLYGLFRRSRGTDVSLGGPSVGTNGRTDCQRGSTTDKTTGAYWHNRWWRLASSIAGPTDIIPRVYRVRVTSTDLAAPSDQSSTNAQNAFSFFASVKGHACPSSPVDPKCPRVYGLGTMQAFTPLSPSSRAELYFSQIGPAYAGKTIKVSLWDPGDTDQLRATLSFRMPSGSGYVDAPFTYTATRFASGGANCNRTVTTPTTSVVTNTGGTSVFQGCWVVLSIPIPKTYTASTPTGEPGPGWWKIRYDMGPGTDPAYDLTTWKTQIIGNPVHLVVP